MIKILKRFASHLPLGYQQELKRLYFRRQIGKGTFKTNEKEFDRLSEWVRTGDWVLDIGANVGRYSARLSEIVGLTGRVFAFEPLPQTFELLSANMAQCRCRNITLLNLAASEATDVLGMNIPKFDTGLPNHYQAHLTEEKAHLSVLCLSVDSLNIPRPIKLAKVDVEGHEISVLKGMENIIKRDHPILIIEGQSVEVECYLESLGYSFEQADGSPNRVFAHVRGRYASSSRHQ